MAGNKEQGQWTHIVLLVDASSSMRPLRDPVVKVVDGLVKEWEQQALALGDMTRLSIYQFSSQDYMPNGTFIECIAYDTDIARVSGVLQCRAEKEKAKGNRDGSWFQPQGNTALIAATTHALEELALTPTIHGDHTFLFYSVTDGGENWSDRQHPPVHAADLVKAIDALPENWTIAALVPNIHGQIAAKRYGYPAGNIMVWDATSAKGVEEAGRRVAEVTASYMQSRTTTGMRSTRSLFVGGQVDAAQVKGKLTPLAHSAYEIVPVTKTDKAWMKRKRPTKRYPEGEEIGFVVRIDDFIDRMYPPFMVGKGWYQLFSNGARRREKIQGNKQIAVMDKKTSQIYVGPEARQIVGLPDHDVTVAPDANPDYEIFVKSTSDNRQLPVGTKLLIMK
jgi:hypothetical protein